MYNIRPTSITNPQVTAFDNLRCYVVLILISLSGLMFFIRYRPIKDKSVAVASLEEEFDLMKGSKTLPNILLLVADDFGWSNVGFHSPQNREVQTPNLDSLAAEGLILNRFYTYKICSPSRCSLQTGRLPVHVNTVNAEPESYNPKDPVSGYAGVPRNMSTIATKLKALNYKTAMSGKWDVGMATTRHTPQGRGYDESLFYFHHANDYYKYDITLPSTGNVNICHKLKAQDLFHNDKPACDALLQSGAYEEDIFLNHSLRVILHHDFDKQPLFLFHSFHLIHTPLQVDEKYLRMFDFVDYANRQKYAAMVFKMDQIAGQLVGAFKARGVYDKNTLVVFFSDNGGPVYTPGSANNHPLRGGKYSDFEGGVRVNAFLSGGLLASSQRGKISDDLVHVSDVYATLLELAGSHDLSDAEGEQSGLRKVDSISFAPLVLGGEFKSRRGEIHLSDQAIIVGRYKLVVGVQPMDMWQGPQYPNKTGDQPLFPDLFGGSKSFKTNLGPSGVLFDVFADPTEHDALYLPETKAKLLSRLNELNANNFNPDRGEPSHLACRAIERQYGGKVFGPFVKDWAQEEEQLAVVA